MTQNFRVAIAGLGTVGGGVVSLLKDNADLIAARAGRRIEITHISARDKKKKRGFDMSRFQWVDNPEDLAAADIHAVIELMGGAEGAPRMLVKKSLENKKHVVTANKALLAHHGFELARLAEKNNVSLMYEAAVAGCVPVVKVLREGLAANRFTGLYGILNGTCNYILTQMRETGRSFADILKEAQEKGYAEADPSFDVDGIDTAHKLCILTALAFGVKPEIRHMTTTGISHLTATDIHFAGELDYKIKLLGIARNDQGRITQSVEPCLIPASSSLGGIEDVYNALFIEGSHVETPLLSGRGAGAGPTASAVVADLIDIIRGHRMPVFGIPAAQLQDAKIMDLGDVQSRFYLRLTVLDKAGVLADVSVILRDLAISIESLIQHGRDPDQPVDAVITTHTAKYKDVTEACARIQKLGCTIQKPCLMRIESGL
ncbi:MAG: homoserine dehydrogenase [Alphaproteobacteria bacterium]